MRLLVLGLIVLTGCDQVFGFDLPEDLSGVPGPPPSCLAPGDRITLPLLADTYLVEGDTTPRGAEPLVRAAAGRSLLAMFDQGSVTAQILEITLSHPGSAVGCDASASCASCPVGTSGRVSLFLTRGDWDEATATYLERRPGVAWAAPGAGGADRVMVHSHDYLGTDVLTSFFAPAALDPQWPVGRLSIQIAAESSTAEAVFGSREGATACDRTEPPKVVAICGAASTCGDDNLDPNETCDDGNLTSGDGCSAACQTEVCGNGRVDAGETCDDGDLDELDGCTTACECSLKGCSS